MTVKLRTEHHLEFLSLKGGCTGSSESTLVKMPHCWKLPCHGSNNIMIMICNTVKRLIFVASKFGDFIQLTYLRSLMLAVSQFKDL